MKITKINFLFFLGLAIPAVLAFRALFLPGPLAWGDAPHFYPEAIREFVAEPYSWINRENNFGGVNRVLWLYPLMFLYGILHSVFGLGSNLIIRVLFYFPAIILSLVTPIFFVRYLKFSRTVQFFASLVYGLNTYFLLLVDGGQLGVVLAYGLFPLSLLFLVKLVDNPTPKAFFATVFVLFLHTVFDPRIVVIAFFTLILWMLLKRASRMKVKLANLKYVALTSFGLLALSAYWLVPVLKFAGEGVSLSVSQLQLVSLLNALLLYQPHWPQNQFGVVFAPPFYFIGIPFLVFASLLVKHRKKIFVIAMLFLIFSFLVKGATPPLGSLYQFVTTNIPLASSFRDSTKFFIPLLLFAGILIGRTTDKVKRPVFQLVVYAYLLFLVYPAISGNLNFVLSDRRHSGDFQVIKEKLADESGFFRTVWFPARHPLSFHTENKPALDAKDLVNKRPFASMNVGSFDLFNFMHNERFLDWFDLLGVKYLIFSGDPRTVQLNEEQLETWNDLLARTATVSGLLRKDWGTSIPVYENPATLPRIFTVNKLIAVIGGDDIYENEEIGSLSDKAFVFFEDGKFDPGSLAGIASESAFLVFNDKSSLDFEMSFLQDYFIGVEEAIKNDWATYESSEYLESKYQLLIRGSDIKEFDYGRGIAFSTESGEKLEFELFAEGEGKYLLAFRTTFGEDSLPLDILFNGEPLSGAQIIGKFQWLRHEVNAKKGLNKLILQNTGGVNVVNVVSLIPKSKFEEARKLVNTFGSRFGFTNTSFPRELPESSSAEVDFEKVSPVRYKLKIPESANWVVFTDSYHPAWKLKIGGRYFDSMPFYSMVNGFYIGDKLGDAEIVFEGQKEVRSSLYLSAISMLILLSAYFWFSAKKR